MKPYPSGPGMTAAQRAFNKNLSGARARVEHAWAKLTCLYFVFVFLYLLAAWSLGRKQAELAAAAAAAAGAV
jgi:hypothetical protein